MRRSYLRFLLTIFALTGTLVAYMGLRLAAHFSQWLLLLILAALVLLFPLVHWSRGTNLPARPRKLLQQLGYFGMGYASWILVLAVARDIYLIGHYLGHLALPAIDYPGLLAARTAGWPAFGLAAVLSLLGNFWAFRGLRTREVIVPVEGLPAGLENLRIAQISDLHIGPTIGKSYVERVVKRVAAADPDMVALTGDIFDGDPAQLLEHALPLAELAPKGRVFFVPGNHEYYWNLPAWLPVLQKLGVKTLLNNGEKLQANGGTIWVGGITDPVAPGFGGLAPDPAGALRGGERADFRLLLSHRPELVRRAAEAGYHLQLSGHTHGGQFFPWTFVASRVHEFFLGLMRFEKTWIYVSPGTGSWGPPVRVGTTPEVTLLTIVRGD